MYGQLFISPIKSGQFMFDISTTELRLRQEERQRMAFTVHPNYKRRWINSLVNEQKLHVHWIHRRYHDLTKINPFNIVSH